jgi:hypothetical protein
MRSVNLNPVLYLQMEIARLYRQRHNIDMADFVELDGKYDILGYLELGYEPFHLTGEEGILDEIDQYIAARESQQAG